jgi:Alw26I/Eco31I/Esp3I family type II restriction m6 adenine DNA methyltransferase
VAANTLIGLDKPPQLTIRNPKIDEKEKALKDLRHAYFTKNTRKEKLALQRKDQQLRKEIAALLEADGWPSTVAEQVAAFDPYDQNTSANWFDPEWMFGVTTGFDIVIGNPPYKVISADDDFISYYKDKYKCCLGGKVNLYKLFIEKGLSLLIKNGTLSYITPHNYLTSRDSLKLREILLKETTIKEIIDYEESDRVFETVTQAVATIVTSLKKSTSYFFNYLKLGKTYTLDSNKICLDPDLLIRGDNIAIERIKRHKLTFDKIIFGWQGEINVSTKKDFFIFSKKPGYLPLIRGNQIGLYQTVLSPTEYCPVHISNRDHFKIRRIVFQEVSNSGLDRRIKATILENVLCGHTTNYLISKYENLSLESILGLLNSKLVNFYFKFYNQTNHIPIGEIKKIPVPVNFITESKKIKPIVDQILSAKAVNPHADTSALEKQIDELVYKLYGLTEEEIKIIEGK